MWVTIVKVCNCGEGWCVTVVRVGVTVVRVGVTLGGWETTVRAGG